MPTPREACGRNAPPCRSSAGCKAPCEGGEPRLTINAPLSTGTALIIGASLGIGAVYADRLAERGYDLILAARDQPRLSALASGLVDKTGRTVEVLPAELTSRDDLLRVEARLRTDASITALVNNAGVGATGQPVDTKVMTSSR